MLGRMASARRRILIAPVDLVGTVTSEYRSDGFPEDQQI
jgi:hypothetical protein